MEGRGRHTEKGSGLRLKNIEDLLRSDSADKENSKKWRQGEEGQESISLKYKCTGTHLPVLPQPVSAAKTSASNISKSILDNSISSTTMNSEVKHIESKLEYLSICWS